jgi:hypothetical protein
MDLQKILAKFADNRTAEQVALDDQVAAEWAAYDAEVAPILAQSGARKWVEAEAIAAKYRLRGIVFPHIALND